MEVTGSEVLNGTNYRLDGEGRALYYWPYRETFDKVRNRLHVGQIIPSDLDVLYVGNNSLLPTSFDLRKTDRQSMGATGYSHLPGKSAHVAFSGNMDVICGALFDRKCRRTDHAYKVSAKELMELGFFPVYAPTPNTPLHLRVIHSTHMKNASALDIPYKAKVSLVELLQDHRIG
ncbi:MAG: hypothetical protein M1365_01250 [Actinobacteria bacterium]|nr:hypothetical protein [Actinomycetota bacterium]